MGKYSSISLDRDRAFDINSLSELLTQGTALLTEAINISQKMENSLSKISDVYRGINREYKENALGSNLDNLSGTLNKEIYQETIYHMSSILDKLIKNMPFYDTSLSQSVDSLKEVLATVGSRVNELKELLIAGDVNLSYDQFKKRLEDLKVGWDAAAEDLAELLLEIENDMLGVSVMAVQYSHDPVNLSTGNFVYDHEDMKVDGEIPLTFHRYYNAKARDKGSMGRCFLHNYELRLEEDAEKRKVTICMGDGQKKTFRKNADGTYRSLHSAMETLTREEDHYVLRKLSEESYVFDQAGKLIRQENRKQKGITFRYDEAGRLEKAVTDHDAFLAYSYSEEGQLVLVTDHTGRTVKLSYEKGKLATVETPQGSVYGYRYGKNGRIEETVNPCGYVTVKNTYDDKRRITRQDFPDGSHMDYAYDDSKRQVVLTERNGSKITYVHDSKYRNTDVLYEDGTKEHFEYNEKNQRILHVDRNGNTTRMAYDNRGNLTQVIDAVGNKVNFTYNADNQLSVLKVNGKEKQKNTFDGKGNLVEMRDALLRRTAFTYNDADLPEDIIQPDGSVLHMAYDERGNISEITNARGGKTNYTYDALNRVIQVTEPNGSQMSLTYDMAGNIQTLTNAAGDVRTYEYNESSKVTRIIDFDGSTIQRKYNALNKPEKVTDQLGRETRLEYDAMWNLSRVTTPDGAGTTYHYDSNNRLSRVEDALGNAVRYVYDGNGNCICQEDQAGHTTRFTYDTVGRLIHVKGEEGAEITYAYDEEGNVTEVQDALGNKVCMEYDEAGQLITETNPMGESRIYTYTSLGKVNSVTDEAGLTTTFTYLPGGQLSEVLHGDGTKESYTYDANGNVKTYINKNGYISTYDYDSLDRIIRIAGSSGEGKEYTYDAVGNVTSVTDVYGHTTRYEYSLTGQLIKVTDALGNETAYAYDACDRLIEIRQYGEKDGIDKRTVPGIDADLFQAEVQNRHNRICHVTRYQRNILGQVEAVTDPLGQTERYTYDAKGQLMEKLDREGYLTKYGYTAQGDVSHVQYADGKEVRLTYNPLRQLQEMEDWLGITRIESDPMGRATKVQYPDGKDISYTYGKVGERTSITYPDGRTVLYAYDEKTRLAALQDGEDTIRYSYDEMGRLAQKSFPNGMRTDYAYDMQGRLAELAHMNREGILDRYVYQYDLMGNKTAIEKQRRGLPEESGAYTYSYDALGRLSEVIKDGQSLRTYEYDAFGNRTRMREGGIQTAYTYNAMNQLLSKVDAMGEETYTYDRRGNLSLIMENGAVKNRYTYGALNRLEQAVNGRGEVAAYTYNGLGHRVEKAIGAVQPKAKIRYTLDLTRGYFNLLQKEEEAGITQTYLWDDNVAGMWVEREHALSGENDVFHISAVQYYLQDELGSPIRLIDQDGSLRESYGYDEFGQDIYGNQGEIQPFGYTGYQRDRIAGTYYAQAREYMPGLGRFTGADLMKGFTADPITLNEYGYCWNNPMIFVDKDGLWPQWVLDGLYGNGAPIPEWLEKIIEGDEAHRLLQAKFIKDYGTKGGEKEFYIPYGLKRNKSGTGRADIVYFNSQIRTIEVYEIKPAISYELGKPYHDQGYNQMMDYVSAIENNKSISQDWPVIPGASLNDYFNTIVLPSKLFPDKVIVYQVHEDGMIMYNYKNRYPQKPNVSVPAGEQKQSEEKFGDVNTFVTKVAAITVLGGLCVFGGAAVTAAGTTAGAAVGTAASVAAPVVAAVAIFLFIKKFFDTDSEECIES